VDVTLTGGGYLLTAPGEAADQEKAEPHLEPQPGTPWPTLKLFPS
jgi:hypothetical protein